MNKEEWLNWRKGGVGSSDAPVIMGVSPWKTRFQLWEERFVDKPEEDNFAMQRGRQMEEPARQCFEAKMNVEVFPKMMKHKSLDWVRASLDGMDIDQKVVVEIKCVGKEDHASAVSKKVPEKYYPQVQHQLAVTGLPGMYYFSFDGADGVIVEVARDDQYIEQMLAEEQKWWDCVIKREAPALSERDYVNMEKNSQWLEVEAKWKEINALLKDYEEKEETLRSQLISLANNMNSRGSSVKLTRSLTKGAVDYSKIPELVNVNLDAYRKKSFYKWTPRVI